MPVNCPPPSWCARLSSVPNWVLKTNSTQFRYQYHDGQVRLLMGEMPFLQALRPAKLIHTESPFTVFSPTLRLGQCPSIGAVHVSVPVGLRLAQPAIVPAQVVAAPVLPAAKSDRPAHHKT